MYQALYRKWRPRTFDEVAGQEHITETLKRQVVTGHLSHAYLFIGTRGTGKTTCARILAKAVNCENPRNGNPCNACRFCRGVDDGSLTDVVELDAASNNGVDNVRQLRDEAVFSPASARRRVYIIDEVHMLSGPAFNALLKILEEPPEHLMFILATTELQKVPATILSRCQRHAFKRLDAETIVRRLNYVAQQEQIALSPEAAALIAGLCEGGMRDALSMLDQCAGREAIDTDTVYSALGLAGNREIAALLGHIARHDSGAAIALFERLWQNGKDPATLLGELSSLLRDLLMRAVAPKGGRALLSGGYDEALLDSFAAAFPTASLVAHIGCIQDALAEMRTGQARTVCELCLITLCEPDLSDTIPMLRARVADLERRIRSGVVPAVGTGVPDGPQSVVTAPPVRPSALGGPSAAQESLPHDGSRTVPDGNDRAAEPGHPVPSAPPEPDLPPFEPDMPKKPVCVSEDDFPPYAPPPRPEVSRSPATAVTEDDTLWDRLRSRVKGKLPGGILAFLDDPGQVDAALRGDELTLRVSNPFARNNLDRPDTAELLRATASELAGRPIRLRFTDQESDSSPDQERERRLEELKRFSIVTFK